MRLGDLPMRHYRGHTLVGALVLLAVCMLLLSVAGPSVSAQARREREHELLRIGALYAQAIADYHAMSPGTQKQYPQRLVALTLDNRFVTLRRHLRTLYPDPVNPGQDWGLVLDADQRVVGVYSRSQQAPIATGPIDLGVVRLPAAQHYADWKFIAKVKI